MSEWKESEIGRIPANWCTKEIGSLIEDKGISVGVMYPGNYVDNGIPLIRAGDIKNSKIDRNVNYRISEDVNRLHKRTILKGGELLVVLVGSPGESAIVSNENKGWNAARAVGVLKLKDVTEAKFISYALRSPIVKYSLLAACNTSVQPTLNLKELKEVVLPWPEKLVRTEIAETLSSLDDKINLLQSQNKTLEQLAETLFRQWFVEEASEDWEVGDVNNFLSVDYGFPFNSKLFNKSDEGLPLIRIRDIQSNETHCFTTEKFDNKYIVNTGDLLAGMDGEFRLHIWSGGKALLNQRVCRFKPKANFISPFFVFALKKPFLNYYEQTKVGTTVIHLGKSDLDEIEIKIPPKDKIEKYTLIANSYFKKLLNNYNQIKTLTQLRDALLPKLMSGEVRVKL